MGKRLKNKEALGLRIQAPQIPSQGSTEREYISFCFCHMQHRFHVENLETDEKCQFLSALCTLGKTTWAEANAADRHKLGYELLPIKQLKLTNTKSGVCSGVEKVHIFRWSGKRPFAGVRRGSILHILAIERCYGDLYEHR